MIRRPTIPLVALIALALVPAGAGAQPTAESQAVAGTPVAQPQPRKAVVRVKVGRRKGGPRIMSKVPVFGTLHPYAPGQVVRVDFFFNGRRVATRPRRVRPGKGGRYGVFRTKVRLRKGGKYAVSARYRGALGADRTVRKAWKPRFPSLSEGDCGRVVKGFKAALRGMGYIANGGPCFKGKTSRGVLAYRKANGMERNSQAGKQLVKRVFAGRGGYRVRHPEAGEHLEANLAKQILVFAKGKRATHVYPISSGKSSTPTVQGHFTFYLTQPGYNSKGMYYSFYFHNGYAIHGYESVPDYPASHGCIRTFIADQPEIYNRIRHGESIYVY